MPNSILRSTMIVPKKLVISSSEITTAI